MTANNIKTRLIKPTAYRVQKHDDKSCTVFVMSNSGRELAFHVRDENQAKQALGF